MSDLFLGLDLGTSGVKLVAFDPSGVEMGRASRAYATRHPAPGMAELDIGHSVVSRAIFVGLEVAVRDMLALCMNPAEAH